MKRHKRLFLIILIILIILTFIFEIPVTETFVFESSLVNNDSPIRVCFISDFHSCYYGKNQSQLTRMVEKSNPDIIIFGGDTFDDKEDNSNTEELIKALSNKYPCFYSTGNHEYWSSRVDSMKDFLLQNNVTVLEGNSVTININGNLIDICGIDDPTDIGLDNWLTQLDKAYKSTYSSHYKILISHRPELVSYYGKYDFDLILSGHAHGGQFEIPFIKIGLYAPHQGFFAKYVDGAYSLNSNETMVVSRGLARESIPLPRFFNSPELVIVEIR